MKKIKKIIKYLILHTIYKQLLILFEFKIQSKLSSVSYILNDGIGGYVQTLYEPRSRVSM